MTRERREISASNGTNRAEDLNSLFVPPTSTGDTTRSPPCKRDESRPPSFLTGPVPHVTPLLDPFVHVKSAQGESQHALRLLWSLQVAQEF